MAKLNIDFCLLDESVVMYGFRALMSGAEIEIFKANPVMLFMHNRVKEWQDIDTNAVLPIGKWTDIRVEGNKLLAKPEFDDADDFALKVQSKVEKGYLNGASIWLDPIATSDDPELMLSGQKGPTVTKWGLLEASIVDIPNCHNALAIRNDEGVVMQLNSHNNSNQPKVLSYLDSLLVNNKNSQMEKQLLAAKLGCPENEVETKLSAILATAAKVPDLETKLSAAQQKINAFEETANNAKAEKLVDDGISAKKLAAGDREKYIKLAKADFDTTKEVIDAMPVYTSIESQLNAHNNNDANKAELAELMKLSGRELYMQGKLPRLEQLSAEGYKTKYEEYFKKEPAKKA